MNKLEETISQLSLKINTLLERDKQLETERALLTKELQTVKSKLSQIIDILNIKKIDASDPHQPPSPSKPQPQSLVKHIELDKISKDDLFWSLSKLPDNRLAGGCKSGHIYIYNYNLQTKTYKRVVEHTNAHEQGVYCLNAISQIKMLSSSLDTTIKLWDIKKPNEMKLLKLFTGHADDVYQVVYIQHNQATQHLISCSFWEGELRLWNYNSPNDSKVIYKNKDVPPRALVNVKERNLLYVSCGNKDGKGHIDVYDSSVHSYAKKKTIDGVYTEWRYGLVEMSKDFVAVSQEIPVKRICLIDVQKMEIVDTVMDNTFILDQGAMCAVKENVAVFVRKGKFFQLAATKSTEKDKKHKLVLEHQTTMSINDLRAGAGVAMLDNKHIVSNGVYTQLIIYKLNY